MNDRDIALRVQDLQALIAHMDASSMWLLPEEAAALGEADYEAWLADLREELGMDDED